MSSQSCNKTPRPANSKKINEILIYLLYNQKMFPFLFIFTRLIVFLADCCWKTSFFF